jgi:DNA-binding MarR family transcriptional regulator
LIGALPGAIGRHASCSRPHSRDEEQMNSGADSRDPRIATIAGDLQSVYATLHRLSLPTLLRLDLTMAQFKALVVVDGSLGISVCELGRELGVGESAASLLVDQLVRRGHVERTADPADRRRVLLGATPSGQKLLGELRHGHRRNLDGWLAGLGDDELDVLARGLRALAQAAKAGTLHTAATDTETTKGLEP